MTSTSGSSSSSSFKFVDIGANLMDSRFTEGYYHRKQRHEPDFDLVLERAATVGVKHVILTAGSLEESRRTVEKVRELRAAANTRDQQQLYCTVGVHPTRCLELEEADDPEQALQELLTLAKDGMSDGVVVAVGEMGLDYDRLQFCPKEVQVKHFVRQLQLSQETGLPLFLHNRSVGSELYDLLVEHREQWTKGVVHSFDDSCELAAKFIELGMFIGLNGCSLRTPENLQVVKTLPLDKLLLETDCPYCDVKRTHAGSHFVTTHFETKQEKKFQRGIQVKGRNEPCNIIQVAQVVAGAKGIDVQTVVDACYANSLKLYGWSE